MGQGQKIVIAPLEMLFAGGDARYLKIGGIEVLRRIYVGVRDERWGTIPGVLSDVSVEQGGDGCRIRFECEHQRGEVHFVWTGTIEATAAAMADGRVEAKVTFCMDGEARSSFRTNRTGICVLHPIAHCAGRPVEIVYPDGSGERSEFPQLIAPHQPFTDIRTMTHEPVAGMRVEVEFEGEVFETEDQRNWSDGSFKTYCRPLSRGFPYELKAGERVRQVARVTVRGPFSVRQTEHEIRIGDAVGALTDIGVQIKAPWNGPLPEQDRTLLRSLALSHLRADMSADGLASMGLLVAAFDAKELEVLLQVVTHLRAEIDVASADEVASSLICELLLAKKSCATPDPTRVIVCVDERPFATVADMVLVLECLRQSLTFEMLPPRVRQSLFIGGGTVGNFTELNRNRPPAGSMPILSWPINPQVHAMDDLSLIENLQGQADTVRTARSFAPAAHLAVGPIILHRRPDPFAAGKSGAEAEEVKGDPRQRTQFGAAWTLVSIKRLAEAGADSLTYYETTGPYGVMDAGEVFPLYHVLKAVGEMKGAAVLSCTSSDELAFDALALRKGKRLRVMVACLKDEPVEVTIRHLPDGPRTLKLGPYEVFTLDYDGKERIS